MLSKTKILDVVQKMPDEFSLDDLIDHLVFLQKINEGYSQSVEGNVISDNKLEEKLPEWLR